MSQIFEPPRPTLAATTSGARFPVRRVFCVGRNYAAHAREMGADPNLEPPFFFTKWAETVVPDGTTVAYPQATANFHYEAELVAAIGKSGRNIRRGEALSHVYGYAAGLDMTRRDLQLDARSKGRPWDTSKNFEQASPLGLIHPVSEIGHLERGEIKLAVNGEVRQRADIADMIWPVVDVITFLSEMYRLEPGDLIYTGTPEGVGPVKTGDSLTVRIQGLTPLNANIGEPAS